MAKRKFKQIDLDKVRNSAIDHLTNLDLAKTEDRRKLQTASRAIDTVILGVDREASGTIVINYNTAAVAEIARLLMTVDSISREYANKLSLKNFRNEISLDNYTPELIEDYTKFANQLDSKDSKVEGVVQLLEKIINTSLENGIGARRDLETFSKEKIKSNKEEIESLVAKGKTKEEIAEALKLDINYLAETFRVAVIKLLDSKKPEIDKLLNKDGKTVEEVATKYKVSEKDIIKVAKVIQNELYESKKPEIDKLLNKDGKTVEEVAETLNLEKSRLSSYIGTWFPKKKSKKVITKEKVQVKEKEVESVKVASKEKAAETKK